MIDKEAFLKAALPEETILLAGLGEVRVRGLSRSEALSLGAHKDDPRALEQLIVRLGLVEPALSEDEVTAWFASAPAGLVDPIVKAVERLSGLGEGAPKSGIPGVRRGSRA